MSNDPNESSDTAFDSGTVFFARIVDKGVVFNGDLATRIAELLCGAHYGDLDCQRPVSAIDRATYWRVEGSRNREREIDGPGPFFASIEKFDGRVTDLGQWFHLRPHPSVVPLIEEHLRKNPDQGSGDSESNGTIFFANAIRGGVVYSSDLAIRLAQLLCEAHFGRQKALHQKPTSAVDMGRYWCVGGKPSCAAGEPASLVFFIAKYDGRIMDVGGWSELPPESPVIPMIDEHLKRKLPPK